MTERFFEPDAEARPFLPPELQDGWWEEVPSGVPEDAEFLLDFGPMHFKAVRTTRLIWAGDASGGHRGYQWTITHIENT